MADRRADRGHVRRPRRHFPANPAAGAIENPVLVMQQTPRRREIGPSVASRPLRRKPLHEGHEPLDRGELDRVGAAPRDRRPAHRSSSRRDGPLLPPSRPGSSVGGAAGLGVAEQLHAEFAAGIGARFGESLDIADLGQDGCEVGPGGVWGLGWFLCFRLGSRKFITMNFPAKRGGGGSCGVSSVH